MFSSLFSVSIDYFSTFFVELDKLVSRPLAYCVYKNDFMNDELSLI